MTDYRDNPGPCDFCKAEGYSEERCEQAGFPYIISTDEPGCSKKMVWACAPHSELLDGVMRRAG